MSLCYSDMRRFDDKIDTISAGVALLLLRDEAQLAALRQQITDLVNAATMEQAEKDALNAKIATALSKSQTAEDRLRSAVPATP